MPKIAAEMSALQLGRLKQSGLHAVGGVPGLYLQINGAARSWVLRVKVAPSAVTWAWAGSRPYPSAKPAKRPVKLAEPSRAALTLSFSASVPKAPLSPAQTSSYTFEQAARQLIEVKSPEWRNPKHLEQWVRTLETYAFPVLGKLLLSDIKQDHILAALTPIWTTKTETASRIRGRIEQVLDWATARGFRTGDNPARWRGHLDKLLPKPSRITQVEHHAALPIDEVPAFMVRLNSREGTAARAFEVTVLTACRSAEARGMTWNELDLEAAVWTVPAGRMKAHREHRVPLSPAVLTILKAMPHIEGTKLVFPGVKEGKPLSDMTLTAITRSMGVPAVPHGFRSTFRDWTSERTSFPSDVCELALAHTIKNKVEAAYRRGDLFDKRRELMDAWAAFCSSGFDARTSGTDPESDG